MLTNPEDQLVVLANVSSGVGKAKPTETLGVGTLWGLGHFGRQLVRRCLVTLWQLFASKCQRI